MEFFSDLLLLEVSLRIVWISFSLSDSSILMSDIAQRWIHVLNICWSWYTSSLKVFEYLIPDDEILWNLSNILTVIVRSWFQNILETYGVSSENLFCSHALKVWFGPFYHIGVQSTLSPLSVVICPLPIVKVSFSSFLNEIFIQYLLHDFNTGCRHYAIEWRASWMVSRVMISSEINI